MSKKTRVRAKSQSVLHDIIHWLNQFRIIGPVYLTSAGLAAAYGWAWLATYGWIFGGALAAFACTCEIILPVIGERIEAARKANKVAGLMAAGCAALAFGVISGVVAYSAAEAPARAYEASVAAITKAETDVATARAALAAYDCGPDVPARRCETMKRENAEAEARASTALADAEADLTAAHDAAAPAPDISVPKVPLAVKIGLGLAIDFVLIIFPWAAGLERRAVVEAPVISAPSRHQQSIRLRPQISQ